MFYKDSRDELQKPPRPPVHQKAGIEDGWMDGCSTKETSLPAAPLGSTEDTDTTEEKRKAPAGSASSGVLPSSSKEA